jgi:CarboxypepD_reg-like domain
MRFFYSLLLLGFLSLSCCDCCLAQTIKGHVVEAVGGTPLFAAVIGEKGTGNGTTSDFDGDFSLKVDHLPVTLVSSAWNRKKLLSRLQKKFWISECRKILRFCQK